MSSSPSGTYLTHHWQGRATASLLGSGTMYNQYDCQDGLWGTNDRFGNCAMVRHYPSPVRQVSNATVLGVPLGKHNDRKWCSSQTITQQPGQFTADSCVNKLCFAPILMPLQRSQPRPKCIGALKGSVVLLWSLGWLQQSTVVQWVHCVINNHHLSQCPSVLNCELCSDEWECLLADRKDEQH